MKCLDTYPLVEIATGNDRFAFLLNGDFVVTDTTIAEFYYVLLQRYDVSTADFWYKKFAPYCVTASKDILIEAMKFRHSNKKKDLSFFDCVGYVFAVENNYEFVTGDKEFQNLKNVAYLR